MKELDNFIAKVEAYCRIAGITESTLCKSGIQNQGFMKALRAGNFRLESLEKLRAYMKANPPASRAKQGRPKKVVEEAALPE